MRTTPAPDASLRVSDSSSSRCTAWQCTPCPAPAARKHRLRSHPRTSRALRTLTAKQAARCAADVPSGESVGSHWADVPGTGRPLPWQPLFSAHERRLVWSAGLQARLVKSFAAEDLSLSLEQVDARLAQLLVLLPELGAPVPRAPHSTRCGQQLGRPRGSSSKPPCRNVPAPLASL